MKVKIFLGEIKYYYDDGAPYTDIDVRFNNWVNENKDIMITKMNFEAVNEHTLCLFVTYEEQIKPFWRTTEDFTK